MQYFLLFAVSNLYQSHILQKLGIKSMRQLLRIDAVRRSRINSHMDESLAGATSIRAFNAQDRFIQKMNDIIDNSQSANFLGLISSK